MRKILIAVSTLLLATSIHAGTVTYNFDSDPSSLLQILGNNPQPWQATSGNPATGGFLALTYAENNQNAHIIFPDLDPGKVMTAFTFECDLRIGNPTRTDGRPADGFSVNIARAGDPVLQFKDSDPGRGYAGDTMSGFTKGENGSLPETGVSTGIAISFDTWQGNKLPDTDDIEGIIVRVDNKTVLKQAMPTRNGACDNNTSLQTGPQDLDYWTNGGDAHAPDAWKTLCWQPFKVVLDETGKLTVIFKGRSILDKFQTSYFPSAGRLILGGRTGGANENTHFDNIKLTTVAVTPDTTAPTVPQNLASSGISTKAVAFSWKASTDDSGKVAYEIDRDGTVITKTPITDTSFVDIGLKASTSYSYKVRAVDPFANKSAFTAALTIKTETETLVPTPGFLKFEVWTGINGTPVDNLINDPKYAGPPDILSYASAANTRTVFPDDSHDNYGGRLSATFTPTETGQFEFFLRSDDASQLFLSTDENLANAAIIAEEVSCCNAFQETGAAQTSAPISVTAGKKYAFQVLWKEGGGNDFAQVAMRKVGDKTAASALQPIPGIFFTTSLDPIHGAPILKSSPTNQSVAVGGTATFSVVAFGIAPFNYQWRLKGNPVPNGTNSTLTVSNAQLVNTGSYDVIVSNFEGSATSAAANLVLTGVPTALFVVGNVSIPPNYNTADAAVKARLEALGFQVVGINAPNSVTADADGKQLIVTSSTVSSSDVGNKFQKSPVPVVDWEQALEDNYLFTLDDVDHHNTIDNQTQINIIKTDHPLAAGLSKGILKYTTAPTTVGWGVPGGDVTIIATMTDDPTHAAIYAYEKGGKLVDGTPAPARRVYITGNDDTMGVLTPEGQKLLDAAITWAANLTAKPPTPTLAFSKSGAQLTLTFTGTLQSADQITGPWNDVSGASPLSVTTTGRKFYRAKQ